MAELVCAFGVLTGALGKMARDISLLMQGEVGEAAEPGGSGRGGSSAMPHKRNPTACALTLAAAQRVPGLVASFLSGMVQEHERAAGAWQAEWPTLASVVQAAGLAVASMVEAAEGLAVDKARMRDNIASTRGVIFAERAAMMLAAKLGRDVAHEILEDAVRKSAKQKRHLAEVLAEVPEVAAQLDRAELRRLEVPEDYLGSAETFRKALISPKKKEQ
jgi:3-carboxy-cis,cis-muconate cycloisomerase